MAKKKVAILFILFITFCTVKTQTETEENEEHEATDTPEHTGHMETTSAAVDHSMHESESKTNETETTKSETEHTDSHEEGNEDKSGEENGGSGSELPTVNRKRNHTKIDWKEVNRLWNSYDEDSEVTRKWFKYDKGIKDGIKATLSAIFPKVAGAMQTDAKVSGNCSAGMLKWIISLRYMRDWAVKMMDAMGKPPSGMLEGAITMFGNYGECTRVRAPDDDDDVDDEDIFGEETDESQKKNKEFKEFFRGMYCSIEFKPSLPKKPRYYGFETRLPQIPKFEEDDNILNEVTQWVVFLNFVAVRLDICVPSLCTIDDLQKLISLVSKHAEIRGRVLRCEVEEDTFANISSSQVTAMLLFIVLFFSFGFLSVVGYCWFKRNKSGSPVMQFLKSLTWHHAYVELFNTENYDKGNKIAALYGVRYIVMMWIIMVHFFVIINFQFLRDMMPLKDVALSAGAQIMTRSALQFESLIIITGFCMGYYNESSGSWKALKLVVRKYFRIMPIIMVTVGLMILLPLAKNMFQGGPTWTDFVTEPSETCQKYGYINLFFIQNFNWPADICLPQTWLFCVELQLAVAFIPVMGVLSRFRVISWVVLGILTFVGFLVNVLTVYNNELPPTLMWTIPDPDQRNFYYHVHFFKPWAHLSVWTIGVAMGHYCHNRNENHVLSFPKMYKNVNYRKFIHLAGGVVAGLVMLGLIMLWPSWVLGNLPSPMFAGFFDGFSKILWALSTVYFLYLFSVKIEEEKQSLVTRVLSSRFCIIMGRLTLVAFVIHPIVQIVFLGTQQTQVYSSLIVAGYSVLGNCVLTYVLSLILSILFELPSSSLLTARDSTYSILEENRNTMNTNSVSRMRNGEIEMTKERF